MPERVYPSTVDTLVTRPNWGAIWAGMFTFIAIWSVFGMLGEAIFADTAASTAHLLAGMSVGMGIWAVILTIVAMFVAGRVTGHLSGVTRKGDAAMSGIVMFGLSVAAILVISVIRAVGFGAAAAAGAHSAYILGAFAGVGWTAFAALFLGWLAAMAGSSSAVRHAEIASPSQEVRRAA